MDVKSIDSVDERQEPIPRPFLIASICCFVIVATAASGVFPWLEGRTNGGVPGLILHPLLLLVGFVLTFIMIVGVVAWWRGDRTRKSSKHAAIFLLLATTPWLVGLIAPYSSFDAFQVGFASWVSNKSNPQAICSWYRSADLSAEPSAPLFWWPTIEKEQPFGVHVDSEAWPPEIAALKPEEVRILPGGIVALGWRGGPVGFVRLAVFCTTEQPFFPEFHMDHISCKQVAPETWTMTYFHP